MVEIFGKQNRDNERKEKEKERRQEEKREESGYGLWTQTALQANCGSVV